MLRMIRYFEDMLPFMTMYIRFVASSYDSTQFNWSYQSLFEKKNSQCN